MRPSTGVPSAVIHLAAMASGAAARLDPAAAWALNAGATAALADGLVQAGRPTFLLVSTGEVYGRDHSGPIPETASLAPCSDSYAASKVGAELAVLECAAGPPGRDCRPFPHTGPGQGPDLRAAGVRGAAPRGDAHRRPGSRWATSPRCATSSMSGTSSGPILRLLSAGVPGEAYNVASGVGHD
ncbi:MAG: NAD-dependent epimerase/dehydratase family protein [Gemmatimonadetes bacterium]|nr:NAD-dependent epimerase/dehydratase family protein [Gemmatimonadota bacterium]